MKAIIKETGQAVEVVSRFMPKKRNVPSRDWMCNLSNGTCISESELEYITDDIEGNRIIGIDNVAREYAENHYSEWEETWYDYDGYNAEPDNDKLELIDAFIAGANWMRKKDVEDMYLSDNRHFLKCYEQGKVDMRVEMMKDAVEGEIGYWNQRGLSIRLDKSLERLGYDMDTKVKIVIEKQDDRPRD